MMGPGMMMPNQQILQMPLSPISQKASRSKLSSHKKKKKEKKVKVKSSKKEVIPKDLDVEKVPEVNVERIPSAKSISQKPISEREQPNDDSPVQEKPSVNLTEED